MTYHITRGTDCPWVDVAWDGYRVELNPPTSITDAEAIRRARVVAADPEHPRHVEGSRTIVFREVVA